MAAPANQYYVEFFCGNATMPFATKQLGRAVPVGSSVYETIDFTIPTTLDCIVGNYITARIQQKTNSNISQCLCAPSISYLAAGGALPVNLLHFTVTRKGSQAGISWTAANESVGSSYSIERSQNGSFYQALGSFQAEKNGGTASYTFTDHHPYPGINYYRLKITDPGGMVHYSDIRMLDFSASGELLAVPNPVQNSLSISYPAGSEVQRVALYHANGSLLREFKDRPTTVNTQQLPAGVYVLKVFFADGSQAYRKIQKL